MDIPAAHFYPSYIQTYIERDVRTLKNISNPGLFQLFLKMCAGRVGQLLNFNKRLVKMPKLYFYDTGLAAYLLGIQSASQLQTHYCKGALFESFIICEIIKHKFNRGKENNCYFWRRQSPASGQSRCNPMERSGQIILLKNILSIYTRVIHTLFLFIIDNNLYL